jgi:type I restriction enzyme S subunit
VSVAAYPAYKDSGVEWIGAVPAHWSVFALKHLVSMRSGEAITSEQIEEEGAFPVFGGNGLRGYTTSYTHEGVFALVGRQGALCGNVNYASGRFWASEHAVVVSPKMDCAVFWLGELLRSMDLGQYSVSAAQPGLSVEAIGNLCIPVPPPREQAFIAAFLDRETAKIDALVAEQERLMALLKEKRQAVISQAVTKGLDPNAPMKNSGVAWLGEVPAHWRVGKLGYFCKLRGGFAFSAAEFNSEGVAVVRMNNLRRGHLDLSDAARVAEPICVEAAKLDEGDLARIIHQV